ncbi:MAG: hypothetical protein AB1Z29_12420 [Desulfobacterales bacterium]|jgi:hypothetical protein
MEKKERRRNKRCNEDTGIVYSFFNQTEQHAALARNYSRFGIYFESDRPLPLGTTIVIRTLDCEATDNRDGSSFERGPAAYYCKSTHPPSEECQELKTHGVAEVKRCENCKDLNRKRYGIGAHFIRPAV